MKDSIYSRILQGETTEKDAYTFRYIVIGLGLSLSAIGVLVLIIIN